MLIKGESNRWDSTWVQVIRNYSQLHCVSFFSLESYWSFCLAWPSLQTYCDFQRSLWTGSSVVAGLTCTLAKVVCASDKGERKTKAFYILIPFGLFL